jgi:hypothetical protein
MSNVKYNYEIGKVYNILKLIEIENGKATVKCIHCGKIKKIKAYELFNSKQNSCRCRSVKHGLNESRIYAIYHNMKDRCLNSNCHAYENYGGRNITVASEWLGENGFINFNNWAMGNGYNDDLTIDRIDIDGNYEPSNCRWITKAENTALSNVDHPRIKKQK